ncbi:MAG: acyloxyacyl hydrolase [Gemmatimonadales bacterium]
MLLPLFPVAVLALASSLQAGDSVPRSGRTQLPGWLAKSYLGVGAGYLNQPFSNQHLAPGFRATSIEAPNLGLRVVVGHRLTERLALQASLTRPSRPVRYRDLDADRADHSVWLEGLTGLTAKLTLPVANRLSVTGEVGLGLIARSGFAVDGRAVVEDASYATVLAGIGAEYRLTGNWSLDAAAIAVPGRGAVRQPRTVAIAAGPTFRPRRLSPERVEANARAAVAFPRRILQVGIASNALGYGANRVVSRGGVLPIFWGGEVEVERGFALRYLVNTFHSRRLLAVDVGASASYWASRGSGEGIVTLSIFPLLRLIPIRTRTADWYAYYSAAGPTMISREVVDGVDTGTRFTFQDLMGVGVQAGKQRRLNLDIGIGHYSNGNIFPDNGGVKIPLTFSVGWAF